MTRLYLFAEGQTEQTFASTVLTPHLGILDITLHKPVLIAHTRKKHKTHRGGGRKYQSMRNDIVRFLKQESNADVFFTTMVDLYALHADFPCINEAERFRGEPCKRVEFLESAWANDLDDPRFIPHIQLHEYEAYVFVDVEKLEMFYPRKKSAIARLKEIADNKDTPELIDDGLHTAPSKRILKEIQEYNKRVDGPQIAEMIGLSAIRSKCPHFDGWLTKLESLATSTKSC